MTQRIGFRVSQGFIDHLKRVTDQARIDGERYTEKLLKEQEEKEAKRSKRIRRNTPVKGV